MVELERFFNSKSFPCAELRIAATLSRVLNLAHRSSSERSDLVCSFYRDHWERAKVDIVLYGGIDDLIRTNSQERTEMSRSVQRILGQSAPPVMKAFWGSMSDFLLGARNSGAPSPEIDYNETVWHLQAPRRECVNLLEGLQRYRSTRPDLETNEMALGEIKKNVSEYRGDGFLPNGWLHKTFFIASTINTEPKSLRWVGNYIRHSLNAHESRLRNAIKALVIVESYQAKIEASKQDTFQEAVSALA